MKEETTIERDTRTTINWQTKQCARYQRNNLATKETTSKEILTQQPNDTENYQWTK